MTLHLDRTNLERRYEIKIELENVPLTLKRINEIIDYLSQEIERAERVLKKHKELGDNEKIEFYEYNLEHLKYVTGLRTHDPVEPWYKGRNYSK